MVISRKWPSVDVVEYLADDEGTSCILAYLEGVDDGRRLFDVATATSLKKPVVVLRGGLTDSGGKAAESLAITAVRLKQLGLVDKVIAEPLGGAHRDHAAMAVSLKKALTEALRQLAELPLETLLEQREDRILSYGKYKEISAG